VPFSRGVAELEANLQSADACPPEAEVSPAAKGGRLAIDTIIAPLMMTIHDRTPA
jgi:hypothetical protein